MTAEEELKQAGEKYSKAKGLRHFIATIKVFEGECKEMQVQQTYRFEVKRN